MSAEIVRLIHGDEHPEGPGFIEEVVPSTARARTRRAGSSSTSARASTSTIRSGLLDLHGPDLDPARVHLPDDADEGPPGDPGALGDPRDGGLRARHQHRPGTSSSGSATAARPTRSPPRCRCCTTRGTSSRPRYDPGSGTAHAAPGGGRQPVQRPAGKVAPFDAHARACGRSCGVKPLGGERPFRFGGATDAGRGARHVLRAALQRQDRPLRRAGPRARPTPSSTPSPPAASRRPTGCVAPLGHRRRLRRRRHRRRRARHRAATGCTATACNRPIRAMTGWNWVGR